MTIITSRDFHLDSSNLGRDRGADAGPKMKGTTTPKAHEPPLGLGGFCLAEVALAWKLLYVVGLGTRITRVGLARLADLRGRGRGWKMWDRVGIGW